MKILSLGLDNSILNKTSALAGRVIEYGELVEKYTVIVPSADRIELALSEKIKAYGSSGNNKLAQFFKIYKIAEKLLVEEKFDIITVQDQYYLALIGLGLSKKFKIGLEIQVHGFEKYYGLRKIIAKYVLPRANAVRCVSQRLKKQLINEFGVKEEKITVVPIFVDTNLSLRDAPPAGRGGRGNFIFLTVGRLVSVKNIGLQIEAMAEVVKKYPNTELWIIGDGAERMELEKLSHDIRATNYVKFLGWQNNLDNYYNQADAFILTSNSEGWGMAVIEAASFGLPIIMTDVGCAGEVIKDGDSGLVIPIGNKEKLVEAMLKIIEDENLRKKLGANAKLAVSQLPNKQEILGLYKKLWEKAMII
ncbi:MAG: glycosyltransferase family 4 protein [bacterium]